MHINLKSSINMHITIYNINVFLYFSSWQYTNLKKAFRVKKLNK